MQWRPLLAGGLTCFAGVAASPITQNLGNGETYAHNLFKWYNAPLLAIALFITVLAVVAAETTRNRTVVRVCAVLVAVCALVQSRWLFPALIYLQGLLSALGLAALTALQLGLTAALIWRSAPAVASAGKLDDVIESPSVEQFRRLAQSSPWRWKTVEFEFVPPLHTGPVHAWIRRPGSLRVEKANGQIDELVFSATPFASTVVVYSDGEPRRPETQWASDTTPTYDADGLVSALPSEADSWLVDWDDPFYENYQWIAMLNPIEIARSPHDHSSTKMVTELSFVQQVQHHGRPAWQAEARTTPEYDPRCECCALLSRLWDETARQWIPGPPVIVRLDLQTGICVFVGPSNGYPTDTSELDVTIVTVDTPMDDSLFLNGGS